MVLGLFLPSVSTCVFLACDTDVVWYEKWLLLCSFVKGELALYELGEYSGRSSDLMV